MSHLRSLEKKTPFSHFMGIYILHFLEHNLKNCHSLFLPPSLSLSLSIFLSHYFFLYQSFFNSQSFFLSQFFFHNLSLSWAFVSLLPHSHTHSLSSEFSICLFWCFLNNTSSFFINISFISLSFSPCVFVSLLLHSHTLSLIRILNLSFWCFLNNNYPSYYLFWHSLSPILTTITYIYSFTLLYRFSWLSFSVTRWLDYFLNNLLN